MSGIFSTAVEAWDELRIHRLRVLLALIGVAVAVCAITGITAATQMMTQALREQAERGGGRDLTLAISAWPMGMESMPSSERYARAFEDFVERYKIEYATREMFLRTTFRFPTGAMMTETQVVDPDYGVIRRIQPLEGTWFADSDADRYAPALVVNEAFLTRLGVTDLTGHPTVMLGGEHPVRCTIIGVRANYWPEEMPAAFMLFDHYERWGTAPPDEWGAVSQLNVWVPPELGDQITELARRDIAAALPGMQVEVYPNSQDWSALDGGAKWVMIGIGGFVLLLGGLGLVNISLVTVRYRIREIGIRRSFGATSGRVFFGVLMESVVATAVAGMVGVVVAVAVIKAIPVERIFGYGLQDTPPFPISAALIGMASAVGVGTLAGLLPAIVAVRVKVIDAIRY